MPDELNTDTWARREAYEHFRHFDQPQFNLCVRLDAAALKAATKARGASFALACHHIALGLVNRHPAFRLRLEGGRVLAYPTVHGSTTVARADDSFGFAFLEHRPDFAGFAQAARAAMDAAARREPDPPPPPGEFTLAYFTTLPWLHFTGLTHARRRGVDESVPRFAFGRLLADGPRLWLPLSVEVHHALMDGVHVGRWVQDFEAALADPEPWLDGPAPDVATA